ncbi:hypothetical protein ACN27G_13170 [Plantactinospora sp. WMMB334]|uniref:hypothetical protein n=1 Tax=Plantactinospora sp. WMMB334 TaxID=3404119 RepID=UPI003B94C9ED
MKTVRRPGRALAVVSGAIPNRLLVTVVLAAAVAVATIPAGAVASAAAAAGPVKWHPGHYVSLDGILRAENRDTLMESHRRHINELGNEPTIKGVKIFVQWSAAEGSTPGSYDAGKTMVDQYIRWTSAIGKRLWISFLHVQFGGYDPNNPSAYFPAYIVTGSAYGTTRMSNGIVARLWQPATMDRVIAQLTAYGQAYNGSPWVEAVQIDETSIAVPSGTDGYSTRSLADQYRRGYTAFRAAWPNTGLRLTANWLGSDALMADLIHHCESLYCIIGGPDTIPSEDIQANRIYTGETGGADYRGVLPFASEIQSPSLGGHEGDWTPAQLWNHAMNGNSGAGIRAVQPRYGLWFRNTWQSGPEQRWHTGILPFIRSINGAVYSTACPTAYPGCDTR